jgi:hypothetical protein
MIYQHLPTKVAKNNKTNRPWQVLTSEDEEQIEFSHTRGKAPYMETLENSMAVSYHVIQPAYS